MKLRRFEFKEVDMVDEQNGKKVVVGTFKYRNIAKEVIMSPGERGMDAGEMATAILSYAKIKDAFDRGEETALLDKESWEYFKQKCSVFRWAIIHQAALDFVEYVKGLKEEEFTAVPAPTPAAAPAPSPAPAATG